MERSDVTDIEEPETIEIYGRIFAKSAWRDFALTNFPAISDAAFEEAWTDFQERKRAGGMQ